MVDKIVTIVLIILINSLALPSVNSQVKLEDYPVKHTQVEEIDSLDSDKQAVLDTETGVFIYKNNSQQTQPIASITKLMTALVFLEHNPGWEKTYTIEKPDRVNGGRVYLYQGEKLQVENLFNMSLVASANTATKALVNSTGLSEEKFVELMNRKARNMGLFNTQFEDPIGIGKKNVSTAQEVAKLAQRALSKEKIAQAVQQEEYVFSTQGGRNKHVESTDDLLHSSSSRKDLKVLGGKTGYISEAGYCFVAKFEQQGEHPIISVVLNSETVDSRFDDTYKLVNWIYENYY